MSEQNPSAKVPEQRPAEPLGDRGQGDKTWTPEPGEQGISNRVDDAEPGPESDASSFGDDENGDEDAPDGGGATS